jgi:hypothetical protein
MAGLGNIGPVNAEPRIIRSRRVAVRPHQRQHVFFDLEWCVLTPKKRLGAFPPIVTIFFTIR